MLKQALASLAAFIGSVNYSESFHMSAAAAGNPMQRAAVEGVAVPTGDEGSSFDNSQFVNNPMYDTEKMSTYARPSPRPHAPCPLAPSCGPHTPTTPLTSPPPPPTHTHARHRSVDHANKVTKTYGVQIMSINIISASPSDAKLTTSLASGAVASAEALQAETAARGRANAVRISAEAEAARVKIEASGLGEAETIRADAHAAGLRSIAAAMNEKGGSAAMGQHIAEQYISQLSDMAKNSNMMIVPNQPADINGVMAAAFGIAGSVNKAVNSLV